MVSPKRPTRFTKMPMQKSKSPTQNSPDRYSLYEVHNRQKNRKPDCFHNPSTYSIITLTYEIITLSYEIRNTQATFSQEIFRENLTPNATM
jgi:hypothetical protein